MVTASNNDGALRMAKLLMGGRTRVGMVSGPLGPEEDAVVRAADRFGRKPVLYGGLGLFVVGAQRTENLVNVFDRAMFGEESNIPVQQQWNE